MINDSGLHANQNSGIHDQRAAAQASLSSLFHAAIAEAGATGAGPAEAEPAVAPAHFRWAQVMLAYTYCITAATRTARSSSGNR